MAVNNIYQKKALIPETWVFLIIKEQGMLTYSTAVLSGYSYGTTSNICEAEPAWLPSSENMLTSTR